MSATSASTETISLAKLADLWNLGRVARGEVARSTARGELYVLLRLADHVGELSPEEITDRDVQGWIDSMVAPIRVQTRRDRLAVARRFFDHLIESGVIVRNPARGVRYKRAGDRHEPKPRRRGPLPVAPSDVVARFLTHLQRRGLRDSTVEQRRRTLTKFEGHLGSRGLLDADRADLTAFVDRLSYSSIEARRNETSALRVFYRWAADEDLIDVDPTVRLIAPRRQQYLPRPMPSADVERVLEAATERPIRQWIRLAAFCGLRAFEIAQVRREEIVEASNGAVLVVTNGKGGKQRTVPLADEVLHALLDPELPDVAWLFPRHDPPSGPISAGQVSRRCSRFLRDLGIPHTLHSLRHFFGTELYAQTQDLRLTQQLLGHGSPVVTSLYTKLDVTAQTSAVVALPHRWRGRVRDQGAGARASRST